MKEKFSKLIDVKTIITFSLVGSLIGFVAVGKIEAREILSLATVAVSFFFAVKLTDK